ncbi:MAG: DNA alkylation repair protein [Oscillospiraceae bacterium]|jgi:3-methyladenine DNA glycosylase AlkD|nr:DNA alkylation repair protein [Oscillospiraceae bacterium]
MDYAEIMRIYEAHPNPAEAERMSAYMRNQFQYLGIKTPLRRELSKEFLRAAKKAEGVDWAFVNDCWANQYRELQYLAVTYLDCVKDRLTPNDIPRLKKLVVTKSWWDTIDGLDRIVGHVALGYAEVNTVLLEWSVDDNIWLRRIAIDHQLLRKERTDTALLAEIIGNNLGQTEFFINKAIGWSLREYSKTNPDWVRDFIASHRDGLAPLSVREASKYI